MASVLEHGIAKTRRLQPCPHGVRRSRCKPAAAPPLTGEESRQQAQAEGLTLLKAENKTGYFCVFNHSSKARPYMAQVKRGGKSVRLGNFATAEEAALCVARSPEGRAAAARSRSPEGRAAAARSARPPLTGQGQEARQQARAEGLMLLEAENTTGFLCVFHRTGRSKPYEAQVTRGGKSVSLGYFATAEEAALCVARSPEGGRRRDGRRRRH